MKIANEITKQGASTKRMTQWNAMTVGFNQKRTQFFKIENLGGYDSNGGHVADVRQLELTTIEQADLLATWRAGKTAWYQQNTNLPLRPAARKQADIATSKTN